MEKEDVFYVKNGEKSSLAIRIITGVGIIVAVLILLFDVGHLPYGLKVVVFFPLLIAMIVLFILGQTSVTISANGIDSYRSLFGKRFSVKHLDPGEYVFDINTRRVPDGNHREKVVNKLSVRTRQGVILLETLDLASSVPEQLSFPEKS